jgi:hypothetical protein
VSTPLFTAQANKARLLDPQTCVLVAKGGDHYDLLLSTMGDHSVDSPQDKSLHPYDRPLGAYNVCKQGVFLLVLLSLLL